MATYAVVEAGGKQYFVRAGDMFKIERLEAEAGQKVGLKVLAAGEGKDLLIGAPEAKGASVDVEVVRHLRGEKVVSFKKKRRKGYHRKVGHRQELTEVKVVDIKV